MAAMSARLRGAAEVFVIDRQSDRLKLVEALDVGRSGGRVVGLGDLEVRAEREQGTDRLRGP